MSIFRAVSGQIWMHVIWVLPTVSAHILFIAMQTTKKTVSTGAIMNTILASSRKLS